MKKTAIALAAWAALSASMFAEEKDWKVEIQAKLKAVEVEDVSGDHNTKAFDENMFDDDTHIAFTYDGAKYEAAVEITPSFFWEDGFDAPVQGKNIVKGFTKLYAGIKFGEVAKLRGGIYKARTNDLVEGFRVNSWIDEKKLGFMSSAFELDEESDLMNGQALFDYYHGPLTIQVAPVASFFYEDSKKFGAQARVILQFEPVTISVNEQLSYTKGTDSDTGAKNESFVNMASVYAHLNMIEGLPILAGAAFKIDSDNSNNNRIAIELRLEKEFEKFAFTLHNNMTFNKDHNVLYNGLGINFPIAEVVSLGADIENYIDFNSDSVCGKLRAMPYVQYQPHENATLKAGLEFTPEWSSDNTKLNFAVPVTVAVVF
ncbi:MAG: hypothetical protein IK094_06025 [Treponema sp.]|nr:hypothetical protein [Treponema sp.]